MLLWMLMLVAFRIYVQFYYRPQYTFIFSVVSLSCAFIFFFWPFKSLYYKTRRCLIVEALKFFYPIGKKGVRFRDFIFGDMTSSLYKPNADLVLSFCLVYCSDCRQDNSRHYCSRNVTPAFILQGLPYLLRMFQCVNKYYYTKLAWPHLGNAAKYLTGVNYYLQQILYFNSKLNSNIDNQKDFSAVIVSGAVYYTYSLFWDLYIDWNLLDFKSNNFMLRDKISFPKWYYYFAMTTNTILRYTWTTSLYYVPIDSEFLNFIVSFGEIYRRSQWLLFRVENEFNSNLEQYRKYLYVPRLGVSN